MTAHVDLVLCRFADEDVTWARQETQGASLRIFVYNAGPTLDAHGTAPSGDAETTEVRLAGWHETHCYAHHILHVIASAEGPAATTVFTPAQPRCRGTGCKQRLARAVLALAHGQATLQPHGFAPIEPSPVVNFWHNLPKFLTCIEPQYGRLSKGRDLFTDVELTSFSPMGSFAVARSNLLSAPRGWLQRASEANATREPAQSRYSVQFSAPSLILCCRPGHTCVPWLMERLWPMLLGTPHRGCGYMGQKSVDDSQGGHCASDRRATQNGQPTASGATASAPTRSARLVAAALATPLTDTQRPGPAAATTREASGAIKLRLDISRVARVARFANELRDDERLLLFDELLAPERPPAIADSCTSQLCAIRELVRMARSDHDEDLVQYLAAAVNTSSEVGEVSERGLRRCRSMLTESMLFPGSVERVQPSQRITNWDEGRAGRLLHSGITTVYRACLDQMSKNPRWVQRPFVYGFSRAP